MGQGIGGPGHIFLARAGLYEALLNVFCNVQDIEYNIDCFYC